MKFDSVKQQVGKINRNQPKGFKKPLCNIKKQKHYK